MTIFLIFFLSIFNISDDHEYYVSVMNIDHNSKSNSLEITLKTFTNDLEDALEAQLKSPIYLGTDREVDLVDEYLLSYIQEHINFQVNKKNLEYSFIGKEVEINETFIYLEIEKVNKLKKLTVHSSILTDHFKDQKNIVQVKSSGKTKSLYLTKRRTKGTINYR